MLKPETSARLLAVVMCLASSATPAFAREPKNVATAARFASRREAVRTAGVTGPSPAVRDEVALLKEQLARHEKQIEELARAVRELTTRLDRGGQPAPVTSWQPSNASLTGRVAPVIAVGPTGDAVIVRPLDRRAGQVLQREPAAQPADDRDPAKGGMEVIAEGAARATQPLVKSKSGFADAQEKTLTKLGGLGDLRFSGDVRVRYEPFLQDGAPTRQRERVRARLNLTGKLTDQVSGGVSLASNALDDVNSTNQTLTGFFTRKTIGFDRYYITYQPKGFKPLSLTAGKVAYPWYRTPLTFDNDLNPEGFAQTLSFDFKNPVLTNVTLVGFQLPFNELSEGHDSFLLGGQLQTRWKLSDKADLGLYAAGVNFNRADPIAVAIAGGTLRPSLPNSNTFRTDATGKVIGYASKFAYLDVTGQVDYKWSARWPMTFLFNFVNNTRAATRERSAYWAEISFGQLRGARDLQFGYSFIRIEKDAVIGAFNESDLRSSTNVRNHRVQFGYQSLSNVSMQWTMWLGKLADPLQNTSLVPSGIRSACATAPYSDCRDSWLNRMQFDVTYKF